MLPRIGTLNPAQQRWSRRARTRPRCLPCQLTDLAGLGVAPAPRRGRRGDDPNFHRRSERALPRRVPTGRASEPRGFLRVVCKLAGERSEARGPRTGERRSVVHGSARAQILPSPLPVRLGISVSTAEGGMAVARCGRSRPKLTSESMARLKGPTALCELFQTAPVDGHPGTAYTDGGSARLHCGLQLTLMMTPLRFILTLAR